MSAHTNHMRRAVRLLAPLMNPKVAAFAAKRSRSTKRRADLELAAPWFGGNNVAGVVVTRKTSGPDRSRGELAIQFLVRRKLSESRLRKEEMIPKVLRLNIVNRDILTDVEEYGTLPVAQALPTLRPVIPGSSIGHPRSLGGTLGLITNRGGQACYLSCSHVLAPGGSQWSHIGDGIEQPSDEFDANPANVIGTLTDFTPLNPASNNNATDAAIALCNDIPFDRVVPGIGVPSDALTMAASDFTDHTMVVSRDGVGTGPARGNIDGFGAIRITYADIGQVVVNDLVIYTASAAGGDSGAAVFVDGTRTVAGLHIGLMDDNRSIFTPIQSVFDALGISL
jgi:hypothetical protein